MAAKLYSTILVRGTPKARIRAKSSLRSPKPLWAIWKVNMIKTAAATTPMNPVMSIVSWLRCVYKTKLSTTPVGASSSVPPNRLCDE